MKEEHLCERTECERWFDKLRPGEEILAKSRLPVGRSCPPPLVCPSLFCQGQRVLDQRGRIPTTGARRRQGLSHNAWRRQRQRRLLLSRTHETKRKRTWTTPNRDRAASCGPVKASARAAKQNAATAKLVNFMLMMAGGRVGGCVRRRKG